LGEEKLKLSKLAAACAFACLAMLAGTGVQANQLSISQYGRVTATLPWAVATEKKFFADEGIEIDQIIAGMGGGTTLRNVLASDMPYGEVAMSAAIAAIQKNIDIVIVNSASNHIGEIALVANPKSKIHTIDDLDGKKVGFTNPKSTTELMIRLVLKAANKVGKIHPVSTGGFGAGLTALDSMAIDAAPLIDPILTLEPDRYRVIFPYSKYIPRMTWLVGIAKRDFAEKNPDMVKKLIKIRRRAVDYIYDNREDAMLIYSKVWQRDPKQVKTYFPKYFGYNGEWSRGGFDRAALDKMSEGLKLIGRIDKPIDWNKVIDQRFLPKDLQKSL
jgi:NitT/TauT family transport system substrate-binding protein